MCTLYNLIFIYEHFHSVQITITLHYDNEDNYITITITITLHYNHVQLTRNHMALSIGDNDDLKENQQLHL